MIERILDWTWQGYPLGAMTLFIGPFILLFVAFVVIRLWLHRQYMLNWFELAQSYDLEYLAPTGTLQAYFEVTDQVTARRHRRVPPLMSLNSFVGTIHGELSDDFWVEMTVAKGESLDAGRSKHAVLEGLSDAALNSLPGELFFDPHSDTRSDAAFSIIRIGFPDVPLCLIQRQNLGHSMASRVGLMQEIEVGDKEFDPFFLIQGEDPAEIHFYLNEKRRISLLKSFKKLKTPGGSLFLDNQGLFYCRKGILGNRKALQATFAELLGLAKALYYLEA